MTTEARPPDDPATTGNAGQGGSPAGSTPDVGEQGKRAGLGDPTEAGVGGAGVGLDDLSGAGVRDEPTTEPEKDKKAGP